MKFGRLSQWLFSGRTCAACHARRASAAANLLALSFLLLPAWVLAQDFTGVQPAALDQPRIYVNLRRQLSGPALEAKVDGQSSSVVECFLDTGASSVVLSAGTSKGLGIKHEMTMEGTPVKYEDVGVGGGEAFEVSDPL
ncbi:MAG TPA: hypothetical protein VG722_12130, partial [Tepidisphaeraceae bacterium]|nr:hypothetical protein [Tepidisphaeraceae bacterium]